MGILVHRSIGTEAIHTLPMVFLDIETTGYTPADGEISEIGALKVNPATLVAVDQLDLQLQIKNPFNKSEEELSFNGYNGFSFAEWKNAVPPQAAITQLNDFCAGCVAWGWNSNYELYWLGASYETYKLDWLGDYHWICLMSISNFVLQPELRSGQIKKLSLSHVAEFFGLGQEPYPHRGLMGARYELEVYKKLIEHQKQN